MKKSELVEKVAQAHASITRREAEVVVALFFEAIADALARGERVELRGFGSLSTRKRRARIARNPKTGKTVSVPAKRVPHFKPGKELQKRINGG